MRLEYRRVLALLLAMIAGAGITVIVTAGGDDQEPHATATVVTGHTKQGPIAAPAPAVQDAKTGGERGLGHETITPGEELHNDRQGRGPRVVGPPPAAAPNQAGCTTRQNTHNFSFRNGVRPSLIVPHLTVAANRPGWGDIAGVAIFLNRPATQASANYIIDREQHCLYTVPETGKAWAQANFNSATACSIEVQNTGNEPDYNGTMTQLARVVHDCAHRWSIPLRRGAVTGSTVTRAGVLDHYHLGPAGGGHFDIHNFGAGCRNQGPGADTWKCVDLIIAKARALDGPRVTAHARGLCQELNRLRKIEHRSSDQARRAAAVKRALASKYTCRAGPPGRITRR